MRYGVVRGVPGLPPPEEQRRLVERAGCDLIFEEQAWSRTGQDALMQQVGRLGSGDHLVVHSPDVFQLTTGGLALMLRALMEAGVFLRMVARGPADTLTPPLSMPKVLLLLTEHEVRRPSGSPARRWRAHRPQLTTYQLRYARQLQRRGESLRSIGLLFGLTPVEVRDLLARQEA